MELTDYKRLNLPDAPGVYLFTSGKGKGKKVLYVGKATSLKDRVRSYFDDDVIATRGPRIVDMVTSADSVSFEISATVLEALVRESALIKKYTPKANAIGKDDKSFLYTCITKEDIPRVLMIRGKDIDFAAKRYEDIDLQAIHGPFTSGPQLKEALRLIRRIFPFFDTPKPVASFEKGTTGKTASKHLQARVEFNTQIGRYPKGVSREEYRRNIKNISLLLGGEVQKLRETLARDMKKASKEEAFELAGVIKQQLFALDHVQDVSLIKDEYVKRTEEEQSIRIEAYDTAHISGSNAIGVMTVLIGGVPSKKDYRTFRIKPVGGRSTADDLASLTEILSRRLDHTEWPLPRVIVVDGGKTHKNTAERVLGEAGVNIPVASVVKDEKHRPKGVLRSKALPVHDSDIIMANSEAHRFSLSKHRQARSRTMK